MIEEFKSMQNGLDEQKEFASFLGRVVDMIRAPDFHPATDAPEGYDAYLQPEEYIQSLFIEYPDNQASFKLEVFSNLVDRMDTVNRLIDQQNRLDVTPKSLRVQDHLTFSELFARSDELYRAFAPLWDKQAAALDGGVQGESLQRFREALRTHSELGLEPSFAKACDCRPASLKELTQLRLDYAHSCAMQSLVCLSFASYSLDRSRCIYKVLDDGILEDAGGKMKAQADEGVQQAADYIDESGKSIRNIERFLAKIFDSDPDADFDNEFRPNRIDYIPLNFNI